MFNLILAFVAAFMGANMNAIPGGGTFLTYPVLLILGNSSIVANATSTVVLWPGIVSSLPGYRKEIAKNKKWIYLLAPSALVGGVIGAFILTHTPSNIFYWVAPFLIVIGATLMQFQDSVGRFFQKLHLGEKNLKTFVASLLVLTVAVYGAYFGAGIGILFLGCLTILGIKDIVQNIALKNVLSLTVNFTAIGYFSFSHVIHWQIVPLMAAGAILGGFTGSWLVRHVNKQKVRQGVVILGYVIAIILFVVKIK